MTLVSDLRDAILSEGPGEGLGEYRAAFLFPKELPLFAGHFPGNPLVPGIMLIEMVRDTAGRAARRPLRTVEISRAKFVAPVLPNEKIEVVVKLTQADGATTASGHVNVDGVMRATVNLILEEDDN